ncbi:MAG: hypothetical protein ABSD29_07480 [Verrucomicrobiota bacterium]
MQRRMRVPNVETLGYCRQVPPGRVHAGLPLPLLNEGSAAAIPVRSVPPASPDNHTVAIMLAILALGVVPARVLNTLSTAVANLNTPAPASVAAYTTR